MKKINMNNNFNELDMQTWNRAQIFHYFYNMAPTGYSITTNIDITILRNVLKQRKIKFFPAYLYLLTKNLNKQTEFKIAINNDKIGYWDTLTPMYAVFHKDDNTFSLMWTDYHDDFSTFYRNYINDQRQYGANHGILAKPDRVPPLSCYTVSCIPWISFSHFAVHSYQNKPYFFPSVEAGKFYMSENKIWMPLSLTLHHAATDGYHVNQFIEDLQNDCNSSAMQK